MAAPRKHPEKLRGGRSGFPQVRLTCCHVVLWDRGRPQSLLRAQPSDPPLAHDLTGPLELNSQEPVAELWVVGVRVDVQVGEVRVVEAALAALRT